MWTKSAAAKGLVSGSCRIHKAGANVIDCNNTSEVGNGEHLQRCVI